MNWFSTNEKQNEYTYAELFNMSEPLDKNYYFSRYIKWNKFSVSDYDNLEQIFKDIAYSKNAINLYRKINFISILLLVIKVLIISSCIFVMIGTIISKFHHFLTSIDVWKYMMIITFFLPLILIFINSYLKNWRPTKFYSKINRSVFRRNVSSLTPHDFEKKKFYREYYGTNSLYNIYLSHNGKKFLIPRRSKNYGNYYSIRNWYLISKYISCKKMSINDLDSTFKDRLFVFITTKNFAENKKEGKLRCWFSPKFSLNFICNFNEILDNFSFILSVIFFITFLFVWF